MQEPGTLKNTPDGGKLRAFVERILRVEAEMDDLKEDRKEIYSEVRSFGYDPKIVRKIVAMKRADQQKRREEQETLDMYLAALGELSDLPLGKAAVARAFG